MTWSVDTPFRVGPYVLAAIVETRISIHSAGHTIVSNGEKRPLMFLLLLDDKARGIDVDGQTYEKDKIENLYPQAIARMTAMLGAMP